MATMGSRIKLLRVDRDLSQKELAKNLGISNVVLSRYEANERKPDFETLEKIADYFDISIDSLFGRFTLTLDNSFNNIESPKMFINNPVLQQWYIELSKSDEENLNRLRKIWDIIKDSNLD